MAAQDAGTVWRIGVADKDYHEFSFDSDQSTYPQHLPQDVNFVVGKSDPAKDFSGIHQGPTDLWAGLREHTFKIIFKLDGPITGIRAGHRPGGYSRQRAAHHAHQSQRRAGRDSPGTRHRRHHLARRVQGQEPRQVHFAVGPDTLKAGENVLEIRNVKGSWFLYDTLFLQKAAGNAPLCPSRPISGRRCSSSSTTGSCSRSSCFASPGWYPRSPAKLEVKSGGQALATLALGKPALGMLMRPVHLPDTARAARIDRHHHGR